MRHSPSRVGLQFGTWRRRTGYTLLELLIASLLLVTLMAAVWNLMSMYSSFLLAGRSGAAEQQLSRSLMDLVATDLRATARHGKDPAAAETDVLSGDGAVSAASSERTFDSGLPLAEPELGAVDLFDRPASNEAIVGAASLPEFSLRGDDRSLTLIGVRQEPRFDPRQLQADRQPATLLDETTDALLEAPAVGSDDRFAPERAAAAHWTQVIYRFVPPRARLGDDRELAPGLHRFEIPVELLGMLTQTNDAVAGAEDGAVELPVESTQEFPPEVAEAIALMLDEGTEGVTHEHIPEVVNFRIEYYSGESWVRHWDTGPDGQQPVAVRISARLLSSDESDELAALLRSDDRVESASEVAQLAEAATNDVGTADPFEAFHPRLYQRTILLDVDRDAVQPPESASPDAEPSFASAAFQSGGDR